MLCKTSPTSKDKDTCNKERVVFIYAQLEIYYIKYIKGPQLNIYTGVDIKPEAEHPIIH